MREPLLDEDGENLAVRSFLMFYGGGKTGITVTEMAAHMRRCGWGEAGVPPWARGAGGHLTKGGAQLWLRHLFLLEPMPHPPAWPEGCRHVTCDTGTRVVALHFEHFEQALAHYAALQPRKQL